MDGTIGKDYLKEYTLRTQPILSEILDQELLNATRKGAAQEELLKSFKEISLGGKRIRSALINLGYLICGGSQTEDILKTSMFIEIFHTGMLIHDDYMDSAATRRGCSTIHERFTARAKETKTAVDTALYGNSIAICAGDIAFFISWELLTKSPFPFDSIKSVTLELCRVTHELVYGQVADITFPMMSSVSDSDILDMLWIKSGIYTSELPLVSGALLAGEKEGEKMLMLRKYAKCLGWAFQIQDDLLGTFGKEEELGKPTTSDIQGGKNTLLINYLRSHGSKEQLGLLHKAFGNKEASSEEVQALKGILVDCGSYAHVVKKGWEYVEEGKQYIPLITPDKHLQDVLESLLVFMMERTK